MAKSFLNQKLTSTKAQFYCAFKETLSINENSNKLIVEEILFEFELDSLLIKCNEAGIGLFLLKNKMIEPVDMQEDGKLIVITINNHNCIKAINNTRLVLISEIILNDEDHSGLSLVFENEKKIYIINLGDELHIFSEIFELKKYYKLKEIPVLLN